MKLIYKADNIAEAHIVAGMLKSQGIEAHVGGHYLQGGVGELTTMGFASIHVDEADVEAAKSLISSYENRRQSDISSPGKAKKVSWPYWLLLILLVLATFFFVFAKRYFFTDPAHLNSGPVKLSISYNPDNPLLSL